MIKDETTLGQEIKLAILKKATTIEDSDRNEDGLVYNQGTLYLLRKKRKVRIN